MNVVQAQLNLIRSILPPVKRAIKEDLLEMKVGSVFIDSSDSNEYLVTRVTAYNSEDSSVSKVYTLTRLDDFKGEIELIVTNSKPLTTSILQSNISVSGISEETLENGESSLRQIFVAGFGRYFLNKKTVDDVLVEGDLYKVMVFNYTHEDPANKAQLRIEFWPDEVTGNGFVIQRAQFFYQSEPSNLVITNNG